MKIKFISALMLGTVMAMAFKEEAPSNFGASLSSISSVNVMSPEQFVHKAYGGNMAEIQMAELAKKKASNKDVKDFAEMMIKDHMKANSELKSIASQKSFKLPDSAPMEMKAKMKELEGKTGSSFDTHYMNMMVKEHQKDLEWYQKSAKEINDNEVKNYISNTTMIIQGHLEKAEKISKSLEKTEASGKKMKEQH
jgi:putative membrane protein